MKTLEFIIPVSLGDDGMIKIKNFRSLKCLIENLKSGYEIALIVQTYREKTIPELENMDVEIFYDNMPQKVDAFSVPSRFQESYFKWAARGSHDMHQTSSTPSARYSCLIGWDGCSPWCLATAAACDVAVERRVLLLHDDPNLYLMAEDYAFYADLCNKFDCIITSDRIIEKSLTEICGSSYGLKKIASLQLPVDVSWYLGQAEQPLECNFSADEINLLAISRMSVESDLETLPGVIAQLIEKYPSLHCYLIGYGERLDRYIQQVALYDLDSSFSFLGAQTNPYPYLRACDALILSEKESAKELATAAEIFGTPIVPLNKLRQAKWNKKDETCEKVGNPFAWSDSEKFIDILEGVIEK